jgi:hypothetical protein
VLIEEYFQVQSQMPQPEAEAGLKKFTPAGVLVDVVWRPGVLGELGGVLNLSNFGEPFKKYESGYLLVARAQEDGPIVWDCMADSVTPNALPRKYLPDSCKRASDPDD